MVKEKSNQLPKSETTLRRIVRLFDRYRLPLAFVIILIGISSVLSIIQPFLLRAVLDKAIPAKNISLLGWLVLGMIMIAVVNGILSIGQTYFSTSVGQEVMHDLRAAVYRHLQRLSLAFFTRTKTGEVQSGIANDIGGVQSVVTNTATAIVSNLAIVLATVIAMFLLDWRLAAFALILLPVFVLLARRVGKQRRAIGNVRQQSMADIATLVEESLSISGILIGKTMGRSDELTRRFEDESRELAALGLRQQLAGRWTFAIIQMSFAIMPALIYYFAGLNISQGGAVISIGTLVAFTTLQTRIFFPIQQLLNVGVDLQSSLALFDRVFNYLDVPVDITEKASPVILDKERLKGGVEFEDVSFRYDKGEHWILKDISLQVKPGTYAAIVGETGSGKTTLGYLVARLYDATNGKVSIDGVDVRDLSFRSLADTVGVVSQETYLFHASVLENLLLAKPEATREEIEAAAKAARIHDLFEKLPEGYDTIVGERGYRFSGGEKQRIAIARTILRNPPILVLDEATSALDTETERAVQAALNKLAEGRTTIAIAHRLSTVRHADQIIVLDRGKIVERGTHEDLLKENGRYAAMLVRDLQTPDAGKDERERPAKPAESAIRARKLWMRGKMR